MALRPLLACALCLRAAGGSGGHCRPREGVAAVGGPPSREHLLVQSRLQLDGPSEAAARRPPGANFTAELSFWESAQHRDSASGASLPAAASASGAGWCQAAAPAADWRPRGACGRRRVVALTFNLNWWRLYDQMNGGKVAEVVAASAPYDFLGFQECDDVERVLADAGLAGDYSGLQGSHALALVYRKSRWLLLASGEADVAEDMRDQYYGRRGVQWARFQSLTGGPPVTFLNHQGPMPVGTGGRCGEMATAHNILHTIKAQAEAFLAHVARVPAYLWIAEDGMKVQGYNGSMAWDTAFAVQAVAEAKLQDEFPEMCAKACGWLAREQVRALPRGDRRHWRQAIRGGWGFSTAEQAWPVSDTTAEAFKAVLCLRGEKCTADATTLPDEHLFDTVQFLLSYQNGDGGWATYENCRGWKWYELLNPSEVFGDIMIDYSYVECSASAMGALTDFSRQFPKHRAGEIARAVRRGAQFIKAMQRRDGSWYGCWGCCFTYGCWFGIEGLLIAGEQPRACREIGRCVEFLLGKQNDDGGWGEDFASCFDREYASREKLYGCEAGSTVVQSAWALLALMAGDCEDTAAVRHGVDFLMRRQLPSGDWAQENVAGVFNRSVGITYTAFRNVFPLWALGRFARDYGPRHGLESEEVQH